MKQTDPNPKRIRCLFARLSVAATALLTLGLLSASGASAAYEGVGYFAGSATPVAEEKFSEEVQLGGVSGMAVNVSGAGSVPAGTVYAVVREKYDSRVAMFTPNASGGLTFSQTWNVTFEEGEPIEHCGPALPTKCAPRVGGSTQTVDVEVNQATGNVYVLRELAGVVENVGKKLIIEYTPDGSAEITRFGELIGETGPGSAMAESPGKVHWSAEPGGMAMDGAGNVYVYDLHTKDNYNRLMVFKPQTPSDFAHYVYAGEVLAAKWGGGSLPRRPAIDAAGHIYVAEPEYIKEYDPQTPAAYPAAPASPICSYEFPTAGIIAMTVDPGSGEVFFTTYKKEAGFQLRLIHQLGPCNEETGEFEEVGILEVKPERSEIVAMAFDPARQLDPLRAPGVLYGGAGGPVSEYGIGKGEPGQSSLGYIYTRATEAPPKVEAQSVSHVTSTTAQLHAQINPMGSEVSYVFQYLSEDEYQANEPSDRFAGAKEAPLGGADLAPGQKAVEVPAAVSGLAPDTAYRYRAVATSHCSDDDPEKVCEGTGTDSSFHTFPVEPPVLPDERVYELVSPAQKNGGEVFPINPAVGSCTQQCKPGEIGVRFPRQSAPEGEAVVYEGNPFSHSEGAILENEYIARRDPRAGWQTRTLSPTLAGPRSNQGHKAFSADLSQGLLFQVDPALSPEAPSGYGNLYAQPTANPLSLSPLLTAEPLNRSASGTGSFELQYVGASADLSRIFFRANDALTEETPFAPEAQDGGASKNNLYEWTEGQLRLVNVLPGNTETKPGASFGAAEANAISADGSRAFWSDEAGQLYVREGAEATRGIPGPGKFLSAAVDGSKVLLTDGHIYDLETEASTDLTAGKGGFQGLVGQSEDLSHIYFVDTAVLDETPNEHGEEAQAGKFNLYAWQEGSTRYVGTLVGQDNTGAQSSDWSSAPASRTAQASPDGRWVAFLSQARLTGYDNTGPCLAGPCQEVFLYDSQANELICASCNPSGALPLERSFLPLIGGVGGAAGVAQTHYLTDEGRLYFDSRDSLVPADTNEGVEDVYQYEPGGVGTCKRQAGCTQLLSAGHEAVDSNFFAIDEDGKNVFFTSRDQLVLRDHDDAIDLYVAREKGGIPAETEVARSECQGEACVPALSPPNDPTPGSSSFEGAGNVDEKKATKKHKKKKHAKKKHAHKRAAKHNRGGAK